LVVCFDAQMWQLAARTAKLPTMGLLDSQPENSFAQMELVSMLRAMRTLLATEFTALLDRAGLSQAGFGRLTGGTSRQANNWAPGRGSIPQWAILLAIALDEISADELALRLEEADFTWYETLGVSPNADPATIRRAMSRLALASHPDTGGSHEDMVRLNEAYAAGRDDSRPARPPCSRPPAWARSARRLSNLLGTGRPTEERDATLQRRVLTGGAARVAPRRGKGGPGGSAEEWSFRQSACPG